jgi:indolepyruvate ferredoxin oxidoreductase beta subunit
MTSRNEPRMVRMAVLALGGQGGGVLVDWIVDLAEHAGWTAQSTSVAGVAQRTGATIYYIEIVEPVNGRQPVMALMPVPGDVDIVIAAELMEAGRAIERGFVTPDRTVVVASSHRTYAVLEKIVPGNGVADSGAVLDALRGASRRLVIDDMQALAARHGSVISASLFGALAGSGALPFDRSAFEAVVERSGVGVQPSLVALRAAFDLASQHADAASRLPAPASLETAARPLPERAAGAGVQALVDRIRSSFPRPAWDWLGEGTARVVDWQDIAYGHEYLDRVAGFEASDTGFDGHALTIEAARWIAVAMSYDDVIRVADLKSRRERSARIRGEVSAASGDVVGVEEYFHPRLDEAAGLLPKAWAERLDRSPRFKSWLAVRLDRGRRVRSQSLIGHLQLRALASLRRWRRGNRRHAEEMAHLDAWLHAVRAALPQDPALAIELLRCRRVVKGYSDTHARGTSRFDRMVQAASVLRGRQGAARDLADLLAAALKGSEDAEFDARLKALGMA